MTFNTECKGGAAPLHFYLESKEHRGVRGTYQAKCFSVRGLETAAIRLLVGATEAVVTINLPLGQWSYLNNPGRLGLSPTNKLAVEIDVN